MRRYFRGMREAGLKKIGPRHLAKIDASIVTLAVIATVAAYAFEPLRPFAPPGSVFGGGLFIVFALLPLVIARWIQFPVIGLAVYGAFMAIGGFLLFVAAGQTLERSAWNDRRCLRIQNAMLKPSATTRTDLPDVFTALKCRPQAEIPADPNWKRPSRYGPPPDWAKEIAHEQFLQQSSEKEVQLEQPVAATVGSQTTLSSAKDQKPASNR